MTQSHAWDALADPQPGAVIALGDDDDTVVWVAVANGPGTSWYPTVRCGGAPLQMEISVSDPEAAMSMGAYDEPLTTPMVIGYVAFDGQHQVAVKLVEDAAPYRQWHALECGGAAASGSVGLRQAFEKRYFREATVVELIREASA